MASELQLLERAVYEMDLSEPALEVLKRTYPGADLYTAVAAYLLGCEMGEVHEVDRLVVKFAVQRRTWGGPNE